MPPRAQTGIDADLLQADVMRFMAIIAFCLIAILALVRNVEAPPVATPANATPATVHPPKSRVQPPSIEPTTIAVVAPATPEIEAAAVAEPDPQTTLESTPGALETIIEPSLEPIAPAPAPEPQQTVRLDEIVAPIPPTPQPVDEPVAASMAAATDHTEEDQGLSLRFQSDRDFLRLISKRDIEVFLFNEQDAQRLSHAYQFAAAQPPRQLYEVLPQTIPDAITSAARRDLGQYDHYRWGIAMPAPIERQILGFVNAAVHGELVIDRYGEVHHVE